MCWPPPEDYAGMRAIAADVLPGSRFRRHLLWRYSIIEARPTREGLRVRNLFRITNRDGSITLRAGCEFTHLSSAMASTIQRYILKVERERNARERSR